MAWWCVFTNYFDFANIKIDEALQKRLGYKKVFGPGEIGIRGEPVFGEQRKFIIKSAEPGKLIRAMKDKSTLGIIIEDNTIIKKVIEEAGKNEKSVFLVVSGLTAVEKNSRIRNMNRMRTLFKFSRRTKTEVGLITCAADPSLLLSSLQMIEIGRAIGADEETSKKMLTLLGRDYDT